MVNIKLIWLCLFSPRLKNIYTVSPIGQLYQPNTLEKMGDKVVQTFSLTYKLILYTSPLIAAFLYGKGYLEAENFHTFSRFAGVFGGIIVVSYVLRAVGRMSNPIYREFLQTLSSVNESSFKGLQKQQLSKYDFEFAAWPVEFKYSNISKDEIKSRIYLAPPESKQSILQLFTAVPCNIIAYFAINTFGIRLVYPGSVGLVNYLMGDHLVLGRAKMVMQDRGVRYKLETKESNQIDSMFIDRRDQSEVGKTLVVCCEGNCGFYEFGIMGTPIALGYSVLGWNHPGFAGSTGTPFPPQELNAIDTVMQFAINELGFKEKDILLFGWSIGGFSSTWAAMNYPNVKGIVLDASFDDIMPLAENAVSSWFRPIGHVAIRHYVNLNVVDQLIKFPGPVLIVRRTEDEVICTEFGDISTNRGNYLLLKLLKYRYPLILEKEQEQEVLNYLAIDSNLRQEEFLGRFHVNKTECNEIISNCMKDHPREYPSKLGANFDNDMKTKVALALVQKYLKDFKSTHCTPLPVNLFSLE